MSGTVPLRPCNGVSDYLGYILRERGEVEIQSEHVNPIPNLAEIQLCDFCVFFSSVNERLKNDC